MGLPDGSPLGAWRLPDALVQWDAHRRAHPTQRANLFLYDNGGGTGKSCWARTLDFHNHVSGAVCNDQFTTRPAVRIYDDLTGKGWELVLKAKRLHQPGESTSIRFGNYQREKTVFGTHSIFLLNYDPREILRPEDTHYWETQATWVFLTGPLFASPASEEYDNEWHEHYGMM